MHTNDNEGMFLSEMLEQLSDTKTKWERTIKNRIEKKDFSFEDLSEIKQHIKDIETFENELIEKYC